MFYRHRRQIFALIIILTLIFIFPSCEQRETASFYDGGIKMIETSDSNAYSADPAPLPYNIVGGIAAWDRYHATSDKVYLYRTEEESFPNGDTLPGNGHLYALDTELNDAIELSTFDCSDTEYWYIWDLDIDYSGNIWLLFERGSYVEQDGHTYFGNAEKYTLVELDNSGVERLRLDLDFSDASIPLMIYAVNNETICLYYIGVKNELKILNLAGETVLKRLVELSPDASIAKTPNSQIIVGQRHDEKFSLSLLDTKTGDLIEESTWNIGFTQIQDGKTGEYDLYLTDGDNLFGYEWDTKTVTKLLNFALAGVFNAHSLTILPSDCFLVGADADFDTLYMLSRKKRGEEWNQPTTVTLGTTGESVSGLREMVLDFNRTHDNIRIALLDYSANGTEHGSMRMLTEITAGKIPDILDTTGLSGNHWAATGLLLDLYPLIDADPEFTRTAFLPNVLAALDTGGALYELPRSFAVDTVVGTISDIGHDEHITLDEFHVLMASKPEGTYSLGNGLSRNEFLRYALAYNSASFLDWDNGECSFDSQEFIELLELAAEFPASVEPYDSPDWYSEHEMIFTDRQALSLVSIGTPDIGLYRELFGADVSFVGFPSSEEIGHVISPSLSLSISATSEHADEAWEFLRFLLSEKYQSGGMWFPVTVNGFESLLQRHLDEGPRTVASDFQTNDRGVRGNIPLRWTSDPAYDVQKTRELVQSADRILYYDDAVYDIVAEEAATYFAGDKSAEDAAQIIQSRASIYVSEQS